MKLRFKKPRYSRKGDTTYCTVICLITADNSEWNVNTIVPAEYKRNYKECEKLLHSYNFEASDEKGMTFKAISIGKAVKSVTDADNPGLAERLAFARARLNCYRYVAAVHNAWFHCLKKLAFGNLLVTTSCPECTSNGGLYDQWLHYQNLVEKEKYNIDKLLSKL